MEKGFYKKVLKTKEAAEYLGIVSPRTLEKWRLSSTPKGPQWIQIESNIGYRVCDLDDYLESCIKERGDDFAA